MAFRFRACHCCDCSANVAVEFPRQNWGFSSEREWRHEHDNCWLVAPSAIKENVRTLRCLWVFCYFLRLEWGRRVFGYWRSKSTEVFKQSNVKFIIDWLSVAIFVFEVVCVCVCAKEVRETYVSVLLSLRMSESVHDVCQCLQTYVAWCNKESENVACTFISGDIYFLMFSCNYINCRRIML